MSMNIGAYTACLHNYDFAEALGILKTNGLTGAEVNVGGFWKAGCHGSRLYVRHARIRSPC